MRYTTHNEESSIDVNGTHRQGEIYTTYDKLVTLFGAPLEEVCEKVTTEWDIQFEDGLVATVYDWKTGGVVPKGLYGWHIGGLKKEVFYRLQEIICK